MNKPANPMDAFNTVAMANKGRKLPLQLPNGAPSEHYLMVGHIYADAFRRESEKVQREFADSDFKDDAVAAEKFVQDNRPRVLATLVYGWSFEQECTSENVINFLRSAPQIADKVNTFCGSNAYFFPDANG